MESTLSHPKEALPETTYSGVALVFLDVAIDKPLHYGIPKSLESKLRIGMRVAVTLRGRVVKALVIDIISNDSSLSLQPIISIESPDVVISKDLFRLAEFISSYYATSLRKVFHIILPSTLRTNIREKQQFFVQRRISCKKMISLCASLRQSAPSQAKVLDTLMHFPKGLLATELLAKSGCQRSSLVALETKGVLQMRQIHIDRSILEKEEFFPTLPKTLYAEQKIALEQVTQSINAESYRTFLLHGITGSGKTEIYLQAIEHARKKELDVIFLVPEITLTTQTIERVRSRFTEPIAILHHRLSHGQRLDTWRAIQSGKIHIAIGARSAIFSPFQKLGLIIVDEEHDSSYKQTDDMPCYHARDVAVIRGNLTNATVILGSATPSFESYRNAQSGKYTLITLSIRPNSTSLPTIYTIDMAKEFEREKGFTLFSSALLKGIRERFQKGEQTILFLNRRGYHTSQICELCREVVGCPHCAISLTFHRGDNMLSCHLCGYMITPPPTACPSCKSFNTMKFRGIGTECVERSLRAIMPEVRTLRLDADTTKHKGSHDKLWKQFRSGKADVLIGTQMIAKGLHFPAVTLVGILHMDVHIHIPDFRSSETAFQLLCQVAGRSGRSLPGEVIIQTHMQNHPVIQMAIDSNVDAFFAREKESRKLFNYPPFSHLARIIFSGKSEKETLESIVRFRKILIEKLPKNYLIQPPIPCSYAKVKDYYRFHFLVRGKSMIYLGKILVDLMPQFYIPNKLRIIYDIDPISTFF